MSTRSDRASHLSYASARLTEAAVQAELDRVRDRGRYLHAVASTLRALVLVAAAAVLVALLVMPVLQIQGSSMSQTLEDRDVVLCLRGSRCETGDVVAFYYGNAILVKRVIATAGQCVDVTEEGDVYVDNVLLDEPYVSDRALGECDIELPYQVPEGRVFVMGDHRSTSVDSRSTTLGCVSEEMLLGRLYLRVWPLMRMGPVG